MWKWLRAQNEKPPQPMEPLLKGAPAHIRTKTYSAHTGYVYQYVYRGYQPVSDGIGTEFVFEANRDRKQVFLIRVQLLDETVAKCTAALGRELIGAERYALAKMSLFSAFDELTGLADLQIPLRPDSQALREQLRVLGRI